MEVRSSNASSSKYGLVEKRREGCSFRAQVLFKLISLVARRCNLCFTYPATRIEMRDTKNVRTNCLRLIQTIEHLGKEREIKFEGSEVGITWLA